MAAAAACLVDHLLFSSLIRLVAGCWRVRPTFPTSQPSKTTVRNNLSQQLLALVNVIQAGGHVSFGVGIASRSPVVPDLAIVKETRNYNKWIIKNEMKNGSLSRMRRTRTTWPGSSLPVWHPLYEYDWQNCAATVHSPPLSRPTLLPLFSWAGYIYLPAFQWDCQWFMRDVELIPKVSPPSIRRNNIAPSCPFDEKKVTGQGLYSSSP